MVLNQLSAWWFEQTSDIVRNHVIAVPDPNVTIAAEAQPLPLEIVVRGYITGVTTTSLWYLYENGDRQPYGIALPNGLQRMIRCRSRSLHRRQKRCPGMMKSLQLTRLWQVVGFGEMWSEISATALAVFKRGQEVAHAVKRFLVDTKYEMGLIDGQLTLIDEVHTPDSSRYWLADSYDERRQPVNFSKEFMRKWYADQGYRGRRATGYAGRFTRSNCCALHCHLREADRERLCTRNPACTNTHSAKHCSKLRFDLR